MSAPTTPILGITLADPHSPESSRHTGWAPGIDAAILAIDAAIGVLQGGGGGSVFGDGTDATIPGSFQVNVTTTDPLASGTPPTGLESTYVADPPAPLVGFLDYQGAAFFSRSKSGNTQDWSNAGIVGFYAEADHYADVGTLRHVIGVYATAYNQGSGAVTDAAAFYGAPGFNVGAGTVENSYGVWIDLPAGGVDNSFSFYSGDQAGAGANTYYEWFDSRGVRRIKEDATFDSVGQAIEALYNPQFTKYTPGAVNYERVVLGQWSGNVAQIGTEAGGTGTPRGLELIGPSVKIDGTIGFYGHAAAAKPTISGSRGANAALASLLTALSGLGLLTDSSS